MPRSGSRTLVDLCRLGAGELDPLLQDETAEWRARLDWDFSPSAQLIRQHVGSGSLAGFALLDARDDARDDTREVVGYGYAAIEGTKGLIGDVYVRPPWRTGDAVATLFVSLLDALIATPGVHRIESQLMLMDHPAAAKAIGRERSVTLFERSLMVLDLDETPAPNRVPAPGFSFQTWGDQTRGDQTWGDQTRGDHLQALAATLISSAYRDHIESRINDQYRSPAGMLRVLHKLARYPSCGFFRGGSFAAFDAETGCLAGLVLASFVAPETGHITELCRAPKARGAGLGYALLRRAVAALQLHGATRVNLTVTTANTDAIRLYKRCGFRETRRFFAYVWERGIDRTPL